MFSISYSLNIVLSENSSSFLDKQLEAYIAFSAIINSPFLISSFALIDNSHKKILITNDDLDYSTSTVTHIKLKDFLYNSKVIHYFKYK